LLTIVDLYAKTVIAVLGFIAPTVTLLLPILGSKISDIRSGILDRESLSVNISEDIKSQYQGALGQMPEGKVKTDFIASIDKDCKKATKKFTKIIKGFKWKLWALNLKVQIMHIFISLALSLIFIAAYYASKCHVGYFSCLTFNENTTLLYRCLALGLSCLSFGWALLRLWFLICIVVEYKTEQAALNTSIKADGIIN
jgi:hypothetical protein